jgi:hypothetical protein
MADLDFNQANQPVTLVGSDETFAADVTANNEVANSDIIRKEILDGSLTIGTTATEVKVGSQRLENRKFVFIYNNSNRKIYWGTTGVTVNNGSIIDKGEERIIRVDHNVPIFILSDFTNINVRIKEGK